MEQKSSILVFQVLVATALIAEQCAINLHYSILYFLSSEICHELAMRHTGLTTIAVFSVSVQQLNMNRETSAHAGMR